MIDAVHVLQWLHTIGAAVLLGTGAGIAFFMVMAHRTRDPQLVAHTAAIVVIADWIFTASAVVVQPITGALLAMRVGWSLTEGWIVLSLLLYLLVGALWIPVLFMQRRMRDLARGAAGRDEALPEAYFRLYRRWFACGVPAFTLVLLIWWLMITRPALF